jgi:MFS family permease
MGGLVVASLVLGRIFSTQAQWGGYGLIMAILLLGGAITVFGTRESPATEATPWGSLRDVLHVDIGSHKGYWRLIFSRLLFLIGVYGIQAFAQYFVQDTLQAENPIELTGNLLATIVLTLIGFSVLAGYLCDRIGRKPMHWIATGLVVVGSILMASAHSEMTVLVFGSIIGAGIGLFISANWALANDLAPMGEAGKFLGLTNLATAGSAALSRLFGPMIDAINHIRPGEYLGYTALFLSAAILSLGSLVALRKVPDRHRAEHDLGARMD